ncbi:MAG: MFS transporter [Myxococcota bacterium]|nr:MFS transporter [Myxococcota bacterium]
MTPPAQPSLSSWLGDLRGRGALVVLGCLLCQLALGYGYVFPALAPLILPEFGWTRTEYTAVRVPQLLIMAAASPLLGMLVVRHGSRRILLGAAVLIGCTFLLLSQIQHIWHLYALLMVGALGLVGLGDITVGQLVSHWIHERRGFAMGLVYAGSNLAGAVLVPIWVGIARADHWRTTFLVMGAGAFLVMLPAVVLLIRDRTLAAASDGNAPSVGSEMDLGLRQALKTRTFWILAVSLFVFFFYFVGVLDHLVLFLTDSGMTGERAVYFFSTALAMGLASKIILGIIADYIPEKTSILADHSLLAISSLLLLALPNDFLLWPFVIFFGFATAARDIVYPLIINRCFGERFMAEIYGALMLALPSGALGALIAAQVYDRMGSYDLAFSGFALANVVAVTGLLFVRDERR